jgi:hypothetical protein
VTVQAKSYLVQTDKNERAGVYVKKIRQWLENTDFPIVVVENTGYTFPELDLEKEILKDRFEIISYVESELPEAEYLRGDPYKGTSEVFSIDWAFRHTRFSSNFIIKITGRFYIPDLKYFLSQYYLDDYDVLTQNRTNRCEMVGCHIRNFEKVFGIHMIGREGTFEPNVEDVYEYRCNQYDRIIRCPEFPIEGTQRGGWNEVYYNI